MTMDVDPQVNRGSDSSNVSCQNMDLAVIEDTATCGSDTQLPVLHPRGSGKLFQVLASLAACMPSLSLGYSLAYSSPALPQLLEKGYLAQEQASWFGSLITLGAVAGGPACGFILGRFGRKIAVLVCSVFYAVSWMLILLGGQWGYVMFYIGRLIAGLGVGMVCGVAPLYISEIAEAGIRGTLVSLFQMSATSGVLLVYAMGLLVDWLWLAIFGGILALLSFLVMLFFPDTPRYLLSKGDTIAAHKSLCFFRASGHDVSRERNEITDAVRQESTNSVSVSLKQLFSADYLRPLLIFSTLMVLQQADGPTPFWFYISTIFAESGFQGPAAVPPLVVSGTAVVGVLISMPLMDRCGRRLLLVIGGLVTSLSCAAMGLHFYLKLQHGIQHDWLPVTSLSLFILAFYVGLATPPWALLSESFPVAAQASASGVVTFFGWATAFIYSYFFLDLLQVLTPYGTFWLISGLGLSTVLFVLVFVKETKKKSLQEISGKKEHTCNVTTAVDTITL